MSEDEMQERALMAVKDSLPSIDPDNIRVRAKVKNFLDGMLFFVYYRRGQDAREYLLYVYVKKDDVILINTIEELAKVMSVYRPEQSRYAALKDALSVGAVAGVIAILITITICYIVIYKNVQSPPEVLSAALTAILGFYFGSKVTEKKAQ